VSTPRPERTPGVPRCAVVTGGGRGIGRAAALALAADGLHVAVVDPGVALDGRRPDPAPAQEVADEIRSAGGVAEAFGVDCRTPAAARELVERVADWTSASPLVLVHAAGTLRDGLLHTTSDDDWDEVLGAHLHVGAQLTRALVPAMREARWGRIVYVGGAAGLVGSVGQGAYDVAKAGLFGLMRGAALELDRRGITVNYLVPFAYTRMTASIPPATPALERFKQHARSSRPSDVAPLVAWLCSERSAGVTGQVLGVRGAELGVWSQPRPVQHAVRSEGFTPELVDVAVRGALSAQLTPLESEFDLFAEPAPPVSRVAAAADSTDCDHDRSDSR
jgi:NAD(P)-dependent dehydrogenase (short-subunit alcohol dehydrogenase family)